MMPLVEMAARMPCTPSGLKPLAAWKLPVLKLVSASTRIASSGTATFHQVSALLAAASFLTPRKLMAVSSAIRMTATIRPVVVRTLVSGFSQPWAKE